MERPSFSGASITSLRSHHSDAGGVTADMVGAALDSILVGETLRLLHQEM